MSLLCILVFWWNILSTNVLKLAFKYRVSSILNTIKFELDLRKVWICQRGNQNLYIKEEQTTQWPKEKVQKDKQRSTKHTYETKDRVTRTPLKTGVQLLWSSLVLAILGDKCHNIQTYWCIYMYIIWNGNRTDQMFPHVERQTMKKALNLGNIRESVLQLWWTNMETESFYQNKWLKSWVMFNIEAQVTCFEYQQFFFFIFFFKSLTLYVKKIR